MDTIFQNSEWIWTNEKFSENEYMEVFDEFICETTDAYINISVCGDYTLFINGKFIESNQYQDFSHYKVYDRVDISSYVNIGKNTLGILVWYFGKGSMRHLTLKPGLIFEIINNKNIVSKSTNNTLSRKSLAYESGEHIHKISPQLGYSFKYDINKEDNWQSCPGDNFSASYVIQTKSEFYIRPIKKLELKPIVKGKVTKNENRYTIDLGEEYVGLIAFSFYSPVCQNINIAYGELLLNGRVKRKIKTRDFSFDFVSKAGKNEYTNYMLRLACRYIEIESEHDIDIDFVGIIPQVYPVKECKKPSLSEIDSKIYDICVNTLKLCMMEHYVDCPWREQCLYAFDSRNQIISGYFAFQGKNKDYARSNLLLFAKDRREDNLLSICSPCGDDLVIPSFSLYYIIAVNEYINYTNDLSLANEVIEKMEELIETFVVNMKDGMFAKFPGKNHWNFYDWSENAKGKLFEEDDDVNDFMINAIGIYALSAFDNICTKLIRENKFKNLNDSILQNIKTKFFNSKTNTFFIESPDEKPTELANSFAILTGVVDDNLKISLAQRIAKKEFEPCSLSMKTFKYDALIMVDKEKYKDIILDEIRMSYKKMLEFGSTTVWETELGDGGPERAGSLCHGWSAIPIYYYNILK